MSGAPNESATREAQRRPNTETTSASTCAGVGIEQVRMKCCLYHIVHLKFTDHSDVVMFTDIFLHLGHKPSSGWKQRLTPHGRTFYIDHNTRTATWVSSTYVWIAWATLCGW